MTEAQAALDMPPQVVGFLQQHHTLTLATASPAGVPRASTFLYVSDDPNLYFWSRATTITARQIEQNPVVSFTIDHYTEDLNQTRGVQGSGECSVILSGEMIARVADLFGQKFPSLAPGSTMSISFFRITPTEIQFIDNTAETPAASEAQPAGTFGAEFHRKRSYSVVANLPVQTVRNVIATLQHTEVAAGEEIVRKGTPADKFFIITEGEAELMQDDAEAEVLSAGQLFGEVAIMRDAPRAATVRARSDVKLLALERDVFRDLIAQALEITPEFDRIIRERLDAQRSDA